MAIDDTAIIIIKDCIITVVILNGDIPLQLLSCYSHYCCNYHHYCHLYHSHHCQSHYSTYTCL